MDDVADAVTRSALDRDDMEVEMLAARNATLLALIATFFATGCDGRVVVAGNIALATVPCVLLWMTVNLQKTK